MDESTSERLILIIEDGSVGDRERIIEAAIASRSQHRVIAIDDGIEAIDFLLCRGKYTDAPRPDLILLELNLPGKDGRELLAEIKANPQLRRIPIVVLTTATSEADIFNTYALQGNCHVVKSTDVDRLLATISRIEEFWLGIVTLPVG